MTITLQALSSVEKAEPVQVRFTLRLGTNGVCECKMDVESTWISYMASNISCFTVMFTMFQNHLLEVDLTQNRETMASQTFTTVDIVYFIMCKDLH